MNITQKSAAESLGVSQALLSHYEKGIRECNLDFVKRAAAFYNVSADYLLGLSDSKHGNQEILEENDIPSDSKMQTTTVFRAFSYLMNQAEENGSGAEDIFNRYFSLAIKKYSEKNNTEKRNYFALCDMAANALPKISYDISLSENLPECLKTVNAFSEELISECIKKTIKIK